MLTIYGVYRSRASRNYWLVNELGIPFQSVPVIQSYRLDNPMGLIPSIRDGDLVLHESLAINLYLARKHGGPLAGQSVEEDGLLTMWAVWAATEVEPHSIHIVRAYDRGEAETEHGRAGIAVAGRSLKRALDMLEKHFSAHDYLVGDRFTVADINAAEVLRYAQSEAALFDIRPALKAWIGRCQSRPAYIAMQATRGQEAG